MRRLHLSLLLMLAAAASLAEARVFSRWGAGSSALDTLTAMGGRLAYRSRVEFNGGEGDLSVIGLDRPLPEAVRELRQAWKTDALTATDGGLVCGTVQTGGRVLRVVLTDPLGDGHTLAFVVEQTQAEFRDSAQPGAAGPANGLPTYPGSVLTFHSRNLDTGASLDISTTSATPSEVRGVLDAQLVSSGWAPLLVPPASSGASAGGGAMRVYQRDRELCFLLVNDKPGTAGATITLLHKRLGMK